MSADCHSIPVQNQLPSLHITLRISQRCVITYQPFQFNHTLTSISILQLDDSLQDFYKSTFGEPATADILTHLRRELIQAVWRILLDDDFMDAYENGIVIMFPDGILRRLFPRFFTYSADYPEK